jgi:hypothetical protein
MGQSFTAEGSMSKFSVIRVIFYQQNVNFIYFVCGFHGLSPSDTGPESAALQCCRRGPGVASRRLKLHLTARRGPIPAPQDALIMNHFRIFYHIFFIFSVFHQVQYRLERLRAAEPSKAVVRRTARLTTSRNQGKTELNQCYYCLSIPQLQWLIYFFL